MAFAILFKLVDRYNSQSGRCDPSYDRIAEDTKSSRRSVIRAVAILVRRGWLMTAVRKDGASFSSNSFSLSWNRLGGGDIESLGSDIESLGSDSPVTRGGDSRVTRGSDIKSPKSMKDRTSEERTGESNHRDVSAGTDSGGAQENGINGHANSRSATNDTGAFERFWAQYPRKNAKLAAEKAFKRAVKNGADPQEILAGAMRYAAERMGQDAKYTKHPTNWLHGGCWADESPPPTPQRRGAVAHLLARAQDGGRQ